MDEDRRSSPETVNAVAEAVSYDLERLEKAKKSLRRGLLRGDVSAWAYERRLAALRTEREG